jgi:hypothetical protein
MTTMLALVLPAAFRRRQTSLVSKVPDSSSLEATKAWFFGSVEVDRLAVDVDQRDLGVLGELAHRSRGVGVDGIDDDRLHAGCDEILDLVELAADIVLRIFDLQLDALLGLGVVLHGVAQDGQEIVVEQGHRYADILRMCGGAHAQREQAG